MRILNVRFKNLNSLAGEWFVNFEHPDYQANGLFLIGGPTGSGKTTLLDAICLALYGRTPRVDTGPSQNEIMTRHTSQCWAEVVFETARGRFRARWEHARSGGKAGGFRQVKRQLARESGEILCEKIREVEKGIQEYAGLDFGQFTRAVLLAQGGFAAFLNSDESEKSAILEKLTDTSIYSELSRLAHFQEKSAREDLNRLESEMRLVQVLDAGQEEQKRLELAAARGNLAKMEAELENMRQQLQWRRQLDKLEEERLGLESQGRELAGEARAFAPRLRELEDARLAATFEGDYASLGQLRSQIGEGEKTLAQYSLQLEDLSRKLESAARMAEQARKNDESCRAAREAAAPLLTEARLLDAKIAAQKRDQASLAARRRDAAGQAAQKDREQTGRLEEKGRLEKQLAAINDWQKANAHDEWLVENMGAVQEKLRGLAQAQAQIAQARNSESEAVRSLDAMNRQRARLQEEVARQDAAAADRDGLLRDMADSRQTYLDGLSMEQLAELLDKRRQLQVLAVRVRSLEEMRGTLRDGQPCPLCGALDHPYASGNVPDADQEEKYCAQLSMRLKKADELDRKMRQVERDRDGIRSQATQLRERLHGFGEQSALLESRLKEAKSRREDLEGRCAADKKEILAMLEPLGIAAIDDGQALGQSLNRRLETWRRMRDDAGRLEESLRRLGEALTVLDAQREQLRGNLRQLDGELRVAEEEMRAMAGKRREMLGGESADVVEGRLKAAVEEAGSRLNGAARELEKAKGARDSLAGSIAALESLLGEQRPEAERLGANFAGKLARAGLTEDQFLAMRRDQGLVRALEDKKRRLDARQSSLDALLQENRQNLQAEKDKNMSSRDAAAIALELSALQQKQEEGLAARAALERELLANGENRQKAREIAEKIGRQKEEHEKWRMLDACIGSGDGKKFRAMAQNLTLDLLLGHANAQLRKITDRYVLRRARAGLDKLDLEVIDNYQAGEARSIKNLSGGEIFIASLALSLGLSAMAGRETPLGSLFLDEGFGTLDGETLETAIDAIASLRQEGKLIGVISHVDALKERIPVKINIRPRQLGRSEIIGPGCSGGES